MWKKRELELELELIKTNDISKAKVEKRKKSAT